MPMRQIVVHVGRTNKLLVDLGIDVSLDDITSEIREDRRANATLVAAWDVSFVTDGTDGKLLLTLDDSVTSLITQKTAWMDLKRITGGEPLSVFDEPVEVMFRGTVTA